MNDFLVISPEISLEGPVDIQQGVLGVLFKKNELVEVLSPGRYSRFTLTRMG